MSSWVHELELMGLSHAYYVGYNNTISISHYKHWSQDDHILSSCLVLNSLFCTLPHPYRAQLSLLPIPIHPPPAPFLTTAFTYLETQNVL